MEKVKISLRKYWRKIVATIIAITLLIGSIVGIRMIFPPTPATGDTVTATYTATANDGYYRHTDANYGFCYDNSTSTYGYNTSTTSIVGRRFITTAFWCYRAYEFFDLSNLPDGIAITSAILSLNISSVTTSSTSPYNLNVYYPETYDHPSLDMITTEYNVEYYDGCVYAGHNDSAMVARAYTNFTLGTLTAINSTTITKLVLRTDEEFANTTYISTTGREDMIFYTSENTAGPPKLYITYTVPYADASGTDVYGTSANYTSSNTTFYSHWISSDSFTGCYGNFTWNGTGTPETFTGLLSSAWYNYTIMTPYTEGVVIQYSLGANNTLGQWGTTGLINMTLTANKFAVSGIYCDVHQNSTYQLHYTTEPALQVGYDGTSGANASWKWMNVGMTAFSHVVNATLELQASTTSTTAQPWVRIYGYKENSVGSIDNWINFFNPFSRYEQTTSFVDWQLPNVTAGTKYSSPNLASIIEEILGVDGWLHAHSLGLKMMYLNGTTVRYFKSYDNGFGAGLYVAWDFLPEVQPYWAGVQNYYTNVTLVCGWNVLFSYQWYHWRQTNGMSKFTYETNNTVVLTNSSFAAVSAGSSNYYYWTNFSFTINSGNPYSVALRPIANASDNLWGYSNTEYTKPIFFNYNASALSLFDSVESRGGSGQQYGLAHTTGRKVFYDNNSDVFVAFYSDAVNMTVAWTEDGVNWLNITKIRTSYIGDHFYVALEPHAGYTFVHYQFGYEGYIDPISDCKIYYRRGNVTESPTHNYSITWQTDENLVYDPTGHDDENDTYPEGIVVDYNGNAYLVTENGSTPEGLAHDNLTMWLYKNSVTNGSWITEAGWPKNITSSDLGLWECSPLVLNDNTIVIIEGSGENTGPEINFYGAVKAWFWNGTTLWHENASTVDTFYRDAMNAVVDDSGQIHVVYHSSDGRILYSRRTTAGVWDVTEAVVATRDVGILYAADKAVWTVPQLGFNPDDKRLFCTWLANDTYLYASYKDVNSNVWISDPVRTLNMTGISMAAMPNVCTERAINNHFLFIVFAGTSLSDLDFYSYYYNTSKIAYDTYLVEGWNEFTATTLDVDHTLGELDVSFDVDGFNWAVVTIDYLNGTQWSLINGTTYNQEKTVTIGSTLWIYCLDVTATWTHVYE